MAINQISISKIFSLATEPSNAVVDRFWFDTTNNELKRYDGTGWVPIKVNADDVKAVYPDNTTTTLSDYLSTLTSAIGDLNTNKQDITDTTLNTTDKTIVGAINEVKSVNDSQATSISNLNDKTSNLTTLNQGEGLVSSRIGGDLYVSTNSLGGGGCIYASSLSVNKVVTTTANGRLNSSEVTTTELEYLTGTTSNIQTQINSLQTQLNLDHPTNTISAFVIAPSSNTTGVSITDGSGTAAAGKGGKIIVSPTGTNVGAVYVTTESTKPTALPLYPNTVVEFGPYADLSDVLVYVDSLGDSVSVQISHV